MERASKSKVEITHYDEAKQEFLDFVLQQYVDNGIKELDDKRLATLLVTKYHAIEDAKQVLGEIPEIRDTFIGFQKYLYEDIINNVYDVQLVAQPKPEYN